MKSRLIMILAVACIAALGMQSAEAGFILVIDDPSAAGLEVVVRDDAAAGTAPSALTAGNVGATTDADGLIATPGSILFAGTVGAFTVTVTTAISKPLIGPARIDLSVIVVSTGAGSLLIGASDTGFTPNPAIPVLTSRVGGTTDGTVFVQGEKDWVDQAGNGVSGNQEFSEVFGIEGPNLEPDAVVTQGAFGPGAFSGTAGVFAGPTADFSITNYIEIRHTAGAQVTSVDHDVLCTPEPSSIALVAVGIPFVGAIWLRRRKKNRLAKAAA